MTNEHPAYTRQDARTVNTSYAKKVVSTEVTVLKRLKGDLPQEVHDAFLGLARGYRKVRGNIVLSWSACTPENIAARDQYIWRLRNAEWSLDAIGRACGLSRERVRQLTDAITKSGVQMELPLHYTDYPVPMPKKDVRIVVKKTPKQVHPVELARLKELLAVASKIRGKTPKYRAEAEELAYRLNQQVLQGVSIYSLAKSLGVTHAAVNFRLVRYGYRKTNGKSSIWRRIQFSTDNPYVHKQPVRRDRRVDILPGECWTVWVRGVEVSDRFLTKTEADALASEWRACGYNWVELFRLVKDTGVPKGGETE